MNYISALLYLVLIMSTKAYSYTQSKSEIQKRNNNLVNEFSSRLSPNEKANILKEITKINNIRKNNSNSVVRLFEDIEAKPENPLILLVQGYPNKPGKEKLLNWYQPFHFLRAKGATTFFHSINADKSLQGNAYELQDTIFKIRENFPLKTIEIIGYSAGGSIALYYLDQLHDISMAKISLTTIASPIYGYAAPKLLLWFSTDIGFRLGVGIRAQLNDEIQSCSHHITTDCNKDIHACERSEKAPQIGHNIIENNIVINGAYGKPMPCGNEKTYVYSEDSHVTILNKVIQEKF